ncbi:MBL fold metallo-hydrolase [Aliarcobacter thereius]|uniref:Carbapenem-hydrolyzing beta-lactamase BlaB-1 n=1 Tax=Aliarcobacter thereius LMG 24486 TaxID=1032240 RepID=A0A1C7WRS3_9BACT|nr:MBL fold metallo-hydrolase [Aliarcobacter thereius]OCL96466.1 Carbapenem-hydrolyzing beta-lactamase BlaB-1 precursor [Aliarcobacter thereius LMG 24486]QBF15573.1 MBL fold metallohydrolase [Aliarcobacter thereius LMG 24486]TLS91668.1 MBL fold metallo-hydrolase [Aliarcobacter thereius]
MRIVVSIFLLSGFLFAFDYNLKPIKVSSDVWCFFGKTEVPSKENGGFMANSCYVKTDKSYVLIDSGTSYNFASQAYNAMKKIEELPVSNIIITHEHDDHWLGNSFYKDNFNSKIYAPKSINTNYTSSSKPRIFKILDKKELENTKIIKADIIVEKDLTLEIDNKVFKILHIPYKAHTNNDLMVYLENSKTMFTGDIVMNERITSNRDGSIIGTLKVLDLLSTYPWQTLVAGHGTIVDKNAIKHTENYFNKLKKDILQAIEDGIEADEITNIVTMDEFKNIDMFDELNSRNVFDGFTELEFYE